VEIELLARLSLLGVKVPGLLTLLGATLPVAGVLLGIVRHTWPRIVFVVLLYAATVFAYYRVHTWKDPPAWVDPVGVTAAIALLAAGATTLGYAARRVRVTAPPVKAP
jgi:hypothetical protein